MPEIIFVSPIIAESDPFVESLRKLKPQVRIESSFNFLEITHQLREIYLIVDPALLRIASDCVADILKQPQDVRPPVLLLIDLETNQNAFPLEIMVDAIIVRQFGANQADHILSQLGEIRYLRHRLIDSEKLAILGNVMAGVLHELKNPLNNLLGSLDRVATLAEQEPGMVKWAEMVRRNGTMLRTSIVDLLAGLREDHELVDVNLHSVLEQALEYSMKGDLALRHVAVHRQFAALDPIIHGSAGKLLHLFLNLIVNAKQAIGKNKGEITVRTFRTDDRRIGVEIEDTGPGIASALLPGLFHQIQTTKIGGSGVGLTLVRRIVEEHHGAIEASNSPKSGAKFRVVIPASF